VTAASTRRRFLAATGAGTLAAPAIVRSQTPQTLRFQSAWPTRDIFHEFALDFARKVNELSDSRIRIEMLPSGSVVKPFELLEAVHRGQVDGAHASSGYWTARNSAFGLFGGGPVMGLDGNGMLAWMEYGGGRALYDQLMHDVVRFDVEGFLYGPFGSQPLGWFRKPLRSKDDLKGLRYRVVGLAAEMMKLLGANPVRLAGSDIIQAFERETIDAAEYSNPSSDRALGFPDIAKLCYLQSYHQPCEVFEVLVNRRRFAEFTPHLRSVFKLATQAASADMSWKSLDRFASDYHEMESRMGVRFERTPEDVLAAQLDAWRKVAETRSAENPMFATILQSQQEFARRTVGYQLGSQASQQAAFDQWFARR
jgi:TRAP-type mannitol/chloroaromatic compound transport system substrate-binding protein